LKSVEQAVESMQTTKLLLNDKAAPRVQANAAVPEAGHASLQGRARHCGGLGRQSSNQLVAENVKQPDVRQEADSEEEQKPEVQDATPAASAEAKQPSADANEQPTAAAASEKEEVVATIAAVVADAACSRSAASEAPFNMAFRNASGTALDEYKEKVPRMSLNQLLQANRKHLPFEGEIEDFATLVEMHHFAQKVYSIDTPEKLLEQKAYWPRVVKVTKSFRQVLEQSVPGCDLAHQVSRNQRSHGEGVGRAGTAEEGDRSRES
jgi:hypothetical protein